MNTVQEVLDLQYKGVCLGDINLVLEERFTLVNTGADTASGTLTLTDQLGRPLRATLSGIGERSSISATFPPGSLRMFILRAAAGADVTTPGWAAFESTGGLVSGVAAFELSRGGALSSVAGVLAAQPAESVTIPVDNDEREERYTGFAVANPGSQEIRVRLVLLDAEGNVVRDLAPPSLDPLCPLCQAAVFVHELVPEAVRFRGSLALIARDVATALVQVSGLFSAIPVLVGAPASLP